MFLDKDGTLVENVPYNADPALLRLTPGAGAALRRLHGAGYRLIVVSNQSGVARGYFPEAALRAVEARLRTLLAAAGVPLAGFYYCPHHPAGAVRAYALVCDCRKPAPGLILRAAREHGVDPARSWLVGDILDDVEAGRRAGCRTVLLDNGNETEWRPARTGRRTWWRRTCRRRPASSWRTAARSALRRDGEGTHEQRPGTAPGRLRRDARPGPGGGDAG